MTNKIKNSHTRYRSHKFVVVRIVHMHGQKLLNINAVPYKSKVEKYITGSFIFYNLNLKQMERWKVRRNDRMINK